MARRSDITDADDWFAGEDKILRFTVDGAADTSGWTVRYVLIDTSDDVIDLQAAGLADIIEVVVPADATAERPGGYRHFLYREDPGFAGVLTYGDVVIKARR